MRNSFVLSLLFLLGLASVLGGCSPAVEFVPTAQPLTGLEKYTELEVAPVTIVDSAAMDINDVELVEMREQIIETLTKKGTFPSIVDSSTSPSGALALRTNILSFDKGSALARFLIGAGRAKMTMHVTLAEKGGPVVAETDLMLTRRGGGSSNPKRIAKLMGQRIHDFIQKAGQE
ncbi:MAG: DUF4410 domain-containing protein [Candidatus Eisenbacteria bacterium]|nr:DUF4410 domain-containing protein [Candidatus Eisenbacteria bacterium]